MDGFAVLDQLVDMITSGVANIKRAYVAADATPPNLDEPWVPLPIEQETAARANLVSAAAFQLMVMLRNPNAVMWEATSALVSRAGGIYTVTKLHIPELVEEAGPEGISAEKLGATTNTSPSKLARILRQLASRHIFREVSPGVFAHNRLSSVLTSGTSYASITADPISKYNGATNISPMAEFNAEIMKGAAFLPDYMATPLWSFSEDEKHAPTCLANQPNAETPLPLFDLFSQPGQERVQAAFNAGMEAHSKTLPHRSALDGFDWGRLPPKSLVVDVGGGVGSVTHTIMCEHPNLRYIIQDLPQTLEDARKYWTYKDPPALTSGRLRLQPQSFFEPQPTQTDPVAVFLLRYIMHDWSVSHCQTILRHLAKAAAPNTRVVILDFIVPYLCKPPALTCGSAALGKYNFMPPPAPLLPSAGSENIFDLDMVMMMLSNTQERTIGDFEEMFQGTGWEIEEIHSGQLGGIPQIVLRLIYD